MADWDWFHDPKASLLINATLGTMEPGKRMQVYGAVMGPWQFMINYDEMHDQWTASYRQSKPTKGQRVSAQSCEPPLAIQNKKYRYYKTREEAEAAARRKWEQLNN